tara:strand:+ start:68393 stop:73288 length:4896 start_codon:yes stop_codon:yes gene_type:complete
MKKCIQFLALIAFATVVYGQSEQKVLLKNHSISIDNTLKEGIKASNIEQNQDFIYRIVQFSDFNNISIGDKTSSYEALEFIPKNALLMKLSTRDNSLEADLKSKGAISAISLKGEWKLSKRLYTDNIPEWAYTDENKAIIWLRYYPGLDHNSVVNSIAANFYVSGENQLENLIEITLNPNEILAAAQLPFVYYVQEKEDPGHPENYTGRTNHRVNTLQSAYPGAPDYDGSGVMVGHGDDGRIGPHIDYTGRMTQPLATASTGDHGDHVAGTIFGAGNLDPKGRGNAPGAEIFYQTYPDNLSDADINYTNRNVRVTVSSYSNGCNAGYTNFTRQMDQDAIDNPNLIHVFSAGNSGTTNCGYGAGNNWGNVTGGHKIAKNVIAVANLDEYDALSSSSSRGPAEDGRIKPDVAAVGSGVISTIDPNTYGSKSGTSMSCPGVGGITAVLYEAYRDLNGGNDPKSGLLKAIIMNTCDDLGNPGPDFSHGYGRVNTRRAFEVLEASNYITNNITNGASKTFQIPVPSNTAEARIMLYWPDLPASTIAQYALVNDLDMEVDQNGTNYKPWILDHTPNQASLNANAVRGLDSLNNIEQVTIVNPGSGDITVTVDGSSIPGSAQEFYIVYEFVKDEIVITYPMGGESFVPGEDEVIRWDAPEGNTNFTLEHSDDGGSTWNVLSSNINASRRYYNWNNIPSNIGGDHKLRISRGGQSSTSPGEFTIVSTPSNISFPTICPDSITITWNLVGGANGYIVYRLGSMYMDSITSTVATFAKVPHNVGANEWYSVAALSPGDGLGRRAIAVEKVGSGITNCPFEDDINVAQILSPSTGYIASCFNTPNSPVTTRLVNNGQNPAFNFQVSYKLDNGITNTQTVTDTILPGAFLDYTFTGSSLNLSTGSSYILSVWANLNDDDYSLNDSLASEIDIYSSQTVNYPYSQDFENFSQCGTANDCGNTTCSLASGWENPANFIFDDIDWRTNSGGTASGSTGPSADHTLGTSAGKYLYLEASGGCDSNHAVLLSPCIDMTTATLPLLEFWYHMNGANMGVLWVDVYDGIEWHNKLFQIAGNQGSSWKKASVSLVAFTGKTIVIRINGKTGDDFTSDIAIDDINLFENLSSPIAGFNISNSVTCIDGTVEFSDNSGNFPTSWRWEISPNTYSYNNGTDSLDQNISVQFHQAGNYSVSLIASNGNGTDTITLNQAVTVSAGDPIPIFEDFEGAFPSAGWTIDNADGNDAWKIKSVVGSDGSTTKSTTFDNFNSSALGEYDGLISLNMDLTSAVSPTLFFDLSYAPKSLSGADSLIIDISTDCGSSFQASTYQLGAAGMSTAGTSTGLFIPNSAAQWRRDSLDLSPYIGSNIKIRFRNYSGGGNAVYLDNINIVNSSVTAPMALFTTADSLICRNVDVIFNDASTGGTASNYNWDFSLSAIPSNANTAGPHSVKFVNTGMHTITLTVSNPGGISQYQYNVYVADKPLAVFSESFPVALTVQFNDLSINDPSTWKWYFGDGDSSSLPSPLHVYTQAGTYDVNLITENRCGTSTRTRTVNVSGIGIREQLVGISGLSLYPNPTKGNFNLSFDSKNHEQLIITLTDLSGKKIKELDVEAKSGKNLISFDLNEYAQGVYLVKINSSGGSKTLRVLKE